MAIYILPLMPGVQTDKTETPGDTKHEIYCVSILTCKILIIPILTAKYPYVLNVHKKSDTEAPSLDLHLSISDGCVSLLKFMISAIILILVHRDYYITLFVLCPIST